MAKIDELYKEAMDNHFLHESTDLDTFKKILSEDNERRGYFNYVDSVAKGFYGSYPSFSVQAMDMLNEKPAATQTAQSTEQNPAQQEPELPNANTGNWQADLYNFAQREQIKAHQGQEQLRRERDASSNLTPEEVKAKAELDRKEEEAILANAPTWVNPFSGAKSTEDKTQIPMKPASFREEAGKDLPQYIVRKNDSEQNVFLNIAEPWFANNEEGKAIWEKKERDVEVYEAASKQEFEGYRSMLQQKVNSGSLSVDQAQKMLDDKAQQLENNLHSYREARENSAYQAAYDANKDRISWMLRQLGIDQTDNSVVDWKKRYSNKVRSSYDAFISAKESRQKAQEAYSVPGAAHDSGRRAALDEAWSKQNAAAHENNLYYLADRFIKKAEEVSAAVRDGKGFGAGFREGISDIANWDFGITDIAQSYNIYELVKKNERWEKNHKPEDKLSDAEQSLLDAASIYAMSQAYNADLLSRGYKAGQSSAASVPFMVQFAAMPIESIKNATARGLLQLTFRKGVTGVRRAARKHTGLFVGTLVATGVQTGTFGSGRIAADYYKGITGNIEAEFDKNGIVSYAGVDHESVKSRKTALKDAVAGQTIENFSEIYLSSLSPFAKVASTSALFKGINKSQIGVALRDLMNSSVGRAAKRAQWNGIIEEDIEEQLGNLLRWVSQSDYTYDMEGLKKAGFNLDDEIDTFLALAPTSIVFGSTNVGGYYVPLAFNAAKLRMNMNTEAEKKMFDAIMRDSRSGSFGIAAHDKIRDVLTNKSISLEGKQAMIEAIFAKYHSEVYRETTKAVNDLAEERYGKTFDGLGIFNKYDNAIYSGVDQSGKKFFITDGHVVTKNIDGETVIDTENSSKEFGIRYQKPDGTIMDEQKVPNNIAMGGIEQSTIANQRKLYVERGKSIILGRPTYTVDGETYSVETNQRLAPKEVEEIKASTETPVVMDEDLPAGIAPIDTQARMISPSTNYRINQRDNSGKVVGYEDIKFSSSGHYLNSDGSINIYDENGEVDPQKLKLIGIWNERGQKVSGDNLVKYILSLNETLRADRSTAIENARKKESDAKAKADAAAAETNAKKEAEKKKREAIDKYIASVVGDGLPLKEGVISKTATPQQKFVWNYQNLGEEEALKRASRAVGESRYNLDKLEDDTTTDTEEKDRLTDIANNRIRGYEEAVRNILGEQSLQQLSQDAEAQVALLLQRDMENAQEEERKHLERMAERQRIREENRKKAGINLDNSGNNSNFAQNSENNGNNDGANSGIQGGSQSGVSETARNGQSQSGGNQQGNGGVPSTDGLGDNQRDREGVQAGLLSTHPDDIIDVERDANDAVHELLQKHGLSYSKHRVFQVTGSLFQQTIQQEKVKNPNGWMVSVHPLESDEYEVGYNDCKCYLTADGLSGIAVTPTGDIISLFSSVSKDHRMEKLIAWALTHGGKKADCYANGLESLYARFGGKVVSQTPFVEKWAPDDWDKESRGQVVFLVFPSVEEALQTYADYKKQGIKLPEVNLSDEAVRNFPDEDNGYRQAGEYRDKVLSGEIIPEEQEEEQEEEQGEVKQQEPVDLTADDVVLMTSGAGTTRQTFVFAKKITDESGNVTYISLGNPYNKSVPAFGKVLRSNWGELDKSKKMFYVKDIDGNPIACYAFTKEDLSTKKFKPGTQLNAVVASSGEMITAATSMPAAYVIGKNGEEVSILKGDTNQNKRIRVESVKALLDYPIVIRYKSEAKGQDEIVFTLRDLLYSGKYKGDSHIISKDDEKKTVKRAHPHPYSVALEYLREESRKAFGADVAGAYTSEFNTQLRHLFEAWNAFCKEIGLTNISDKLNKLSQSERDMFWSARAFIGGSNLDEADKASLTVSTDVDAKQMSEYLRANPLHQLAVMLYIGSKVAPQYVSGAEFAILPGKSGEAGKGRVKNVQPMVTKDVIEKVRERYKALKAGKVSFNADSYVSEADEITNLERYYPEVLTDEPVHNRPRMTVDNEKQVKQEIQNNKLQEEAAKKAAKEAAKTDEEREADQYDILEKTIEEGFSKLEAALAEKNDEKVQEYTAQLNMLIAGNEAAQQRLQDMLAEAMAKEVEHPVPVEPAAPVVEEQPAAQEPEVTTEEPAAEAAPQAEEEVPAPEKRRKRNKKETPADQLRTMMENVRDLKNRMALGDREVTPSSIQEATDAIMDFISENGDTEELWNMYNAEFSVSPEQIATTERSRAIGNILLRMIGRIKGPKVRVLNTREDVERKRAELRSAQNGDTVEDLQTPEGIIYGFAIGDEIYITPEGLNADTPIHEFTHLWVKTLRANDRKLWKKIVKELKQNKSLWEAVTKDENYKHLTSDDAIASEVLARFCGKKGSELLEQIAKGQKFGSERLEKAFINRAKRSVRTFWQWVAEKLFGWAGYKAKYNEETIDDFADMVLRDLFDGKELLTEKERNAKEDERIQKEMADIKDKAIKDGTFLTYKGRKSNLPERLWLLVRTENFKDWFGDWENDPLNSSKVVDENGEPLVVYHGTNAAGFDRFRLDKDADARSGSQGFYNTDNRRVAAGYTREAWNELPKDAQEAILGADPHEAIYSLFANIRNPWRIDFSDEDGNKRHWNEYPSGKWAVMGNEELGIEEGLFNSEEEANEYLSQFGGNEKPFQVMLSTDDFLRKASAAGFDGCIFTGVYDGNFTIGEDMTDYVALLPSQLKSVHNRGYFSTIDDRIEYAAAKSKAEYADAKIYVNARSMMRDMIASLGDRKKEISKKDEIGRIEKIIVKGLDRTESLRRMMECLNSYRKLNGLPPVDDKHDIRTLIETSESRIENETDAMTNGIAAEFTDAWKELCDAIEKSNFYKDYAEEISPYGDTDARKRLVVHLTPLQLLERYLMAVDNIEERFDAKTERGLVELAQRLTGQHEDTEISREDALYYAIQFVEAFEHEFGSREASGNLVSDLWKKIKTMTDYALDKDYEGGNLSKEKYDELKAKKYYVPQRGNFHEEEESNTPNDTDLTRQGRSIKLDSMRKAEGGKSLGNAPISHILRDAEEAITKCELNKVKIAMFEVIRENEAFAKANGIKTERVYFKRVEGEEKPVRVKESDADYVKATTEELNAQIAELEEEKKLAISDAEVEAIQSEIDNRIMQLNYSLTEDETHRLCMSEYNAGVSVPFIMDGVQQEISFPPRFQYIAYALNGVTDPRWRSEIFKMVMGWLSAQFTVNNIAFPIVNITRDIAFVNTKGAAEYGIEFNARFLVNFVRCQRVVGRYALSKNSMWFGKVMSQQAEVGTERYLDEYPAAFREFLEAGANTGYSNLPSIHQFMSHVRDIAPGMKWREMSSEDKTKKVLRGVGKVVGVLELRPLANCINEWSELITRFAIYKSIIDMGLGKNEATKAAHNLSVNFNRKGFGSKIVNLINTLSVFANAALQGSSGYWRTFYKASDSGDDKKKHAMKAVASMVLFPALLGAIDAYMNPDDGEDDYVTELDRFNYAIFGNIRIPLNEQLKPMWNLGVLAVLLAQNKITWGKACEQLAISIIRGWIPIAPNVADAIIDGKRSENMGVFMERLFMPTFLQSFSQIAHNENFMGGAIRYDFEKKLPQYMLAENEPWMFKELAYDLYKYGIFGIGAGRTDLSPDGKREIGSAYKGAEDNYEKLSTLIDANPREIRQMLFFIPRGSLEVINLLAAVTHDVRVGNKFGTSFDISDVPILNRLYREPLPDAYRMNVRREGMDLYEELNNPVESLNLASKGNEAYKEMELSRGEEEAAQKNKEKVSEIEREIEDNFGDKSMRGVTQESLRILLGALDRANMRKRAKKLGLNEEVALGEWVKEEDPKTIEQLEKEERELCEAIDFVVKTYRGLNPDVTNEGREEKERNNSIDELDKAFKKLNKE